jgi:hypothetical protein
MGEFKMLIDPKQDKRCWNKICEISDERRISGEECPFSYIDDEDNQKCGYG